MSNRKLNELKEKNEALELLNQDLNLKLKMREDEKRYLYIIIREMKESYEKELKLKNDIYTQNIGLISKTHQEEIRKLRLEYEDRMENLIKVSEEEKLELQEINSKLEKENYVLFNKLNSIEKSTNEKVELIEYQKKYLAEMRSLQKTFLEYKEKTEKEVNYF